MRGDDPGHVEDGVVQKLKQIMGFYSFAFELYKDVGYVGYVGYMCQDPKLAYRVQLCAWSSIDLP